MIFPNAIVLRLMDWIASRLGFDLGLQDAGIMDSLDEQEITEQLRYGRD